MSDTNGNTSSIDPTPDWRNYAYFYWCSECEIHAEIDQDTALAWLDQPMHCLACGLDIMPLIEKHNLKDKSENRIIILEPVGSVQNTLNTADLAELVTLWQDEDTLETAAKEAGVSASILAEVKKGQTHNVTLDIFLKLCNWIGVGPDRFIETKEQESSH